MKLKMVELIRSDGTFATRLKKVTERRMKIDEKVKILTQQLQDKRNGRMTTIQKYAFDL